MKLTLTILKDVYAICRLSPGPIPSWAVQGEGLYSITQTGDELSIVCQEDFVPNHVIAERSYKILKVAGPLDLSLTGITVGLAGPLANAKIPIFAVLTYDTDYLLVKEENIVKAKELLSSFCIFT